jgi:hypothetical protein
MPKSFIVFLVIIATGLGLWIVLTPLGNDVSTSCMHAATGKKLTLEEATNIAIASECGDRLKETRTCNEKTGVWWIDLDIEQEGCNPACAIDVTAKRAEINWRCTGTLPDIDSRNATYLIEGTPYTFVNGTAERETTPADTTTKVTATIWDKPANGDLNRDGLPDAAVIISRKPDENSTLFYVAAAIQDKESGGIIGTNAIFLGDQIAPENIVIENNVVIVNYLTRRQDEPKTAEPSVPGTSRYVFTGTALTPEKTE